MQDLLAAMKQREEMGTGPWSQDGDHGGGRAHVWCLVACSSPEEALESESESEEDDDDEEEDDDEDEDKSQTSEDDDEEHDDVSEEK